MMMAWRCCCCCLLFRLSVVIFVCSRLQLRLFVVIAWMQAALFTYIFHTTICVCNAYIYIYSARVLIFNCTFYAAPKFSLYGFWIDPIPMFHVSLYVSIFRIIFRRWMVHIVDAYIITRILSKPNHCRSKPAAAAAVATATAKKRHTMSEHRKKNAKVKRCCFYFHQLTNTNLLSYWMPSMWKWNIMIYCLLPALTTAVAACFMSHCVYNVSTAAFENQALVRRWLFFLSTNFRFGIFVILFSLFCFFHSFICVCSFDACNIFRKYVCPFHWVLPWSTDNTFFSIHFIPFWFWYLHDSVAQWRQRQILCVENGKNRMKKKTYSHQNQTLLNHSFHYYLIQLSD